MADFPMESGGPISQGGKGSVVTLANWAGALVSLALLAGIGVWGYRLMVRDVTGVPVVAAADGPMRIAPEDPGGRPAEHQGLAVNRVAGTGAAEAPADRLVLAPSPVALSDEDVPTGQIETLRSVAMAAETAAAGTTEETTAATSSDPLANYRPTGNSETDLAALVDALAGDAEPLSGAGTTVETALVRTSLAGDTVQETRPAPAAVKPVPPGALARSLRPQVRPARLRTASLAPSTTTPSTQRQATAEVEPSAIPAGTRLVQLGAYDSPEVARKEWDRLATRFEDYIPGKQRVIQRATSGGRVFYRLRAMGFSDLSDARRFCAQLVSQKADCIPVVTR